jgi:hypothetical protein
LILTVIAAVAAVAAADCGESHDRSGETGETEDPIVGGVLSVLQTMVRIDLFNQIDAALAAQGPARNPTALCSGRRIARGVILTAAHCVYGMVMADISFPNLPAGGGGQVTFQGILKGAIADGYAGAHMDARDIAVLLYNEAPNLGIAPTPLAQPQWAPAGGQGRDYGRRDQNGDDGAPNTYYRSPTVFYTHAQQQLTIIASTTNPPPAMAGAPVEAPVLHSGDSGGPFGVWRDGGNPFTIAVNSAGDSDCLDNGVAVAGHPRVLREVVKRLRRTMAPIAAAWVDTPVGRSYWAGFDNTALTWLAGFVAQAAINNGAWPAAYNLAPVAATWYSMNNPDHCVSRYAGFVGQEDCAARPALFNNQYPICLDAASNKINFNLNNNPPIAADVLRTFLPGMADACARNNESCTDTVDYRDTSCSAWCGAIAARSNAVVFTSGCGPKAARPICPGAGPTDYVAECKCQIIPLGPGGGGGSGVVTAVIHNAGGRASPRSVAFDAGTGSGGVDAGSGSGMFDAGGLADAGSGSGMFDAGGVFDAGGGVDASTSTPIDVSGDPSWATNLPPTPGCDSPDTNNDCWLATNNVGSVEHELGGGSSTVDYGTSSPDEPPGADQGL